MEIRLAAATEEYLLDKVKSGDYASVGEVVDAMVQQVQEDEQEISEEDWRAIEEGEADFASGRFMDFKTFAEELRKQDKP